MVARPAVATTSGNFFVPVAFNHGSLSLGKLVLRRFGLTIVHWEWVWLLALLPAVILIRPGLTPLLLILPALWLLRKLVSGRFVTPTPLDGALLLLLLMLLVSLYATFDLAFSLDKIAGLLLGVALFYAVTAMASRSPGWMAVAVSLHLGWGTAVALFGFLGTRWSNKLPLLGGLIAQLPPRLLTIPGGPDTLNPNQVAGVLLWVVPVAWLLVALLLWRPAPLRQRWRWSGWGIILLLTLATTLFMTAVLLLTQSRSAIIGLAVAVGVMLLLVSWLRSARFLAVTAVLLLLLAAGFWQAAAGGSLAVLGNGADGLLDDQLTLRSLDGRVEIWSRAVYGLQDFPFTGMGMGAFRRVVHILYPLFLISPTTDIAHAHNQFLQTGLDLGLPGLVAYLALWLGTAVMLGQVMIKARDPWLRGLAVGLAGSLVAYFVYGLTDTVALGAKPGFIFWYLLGLVAGLHRLSQREKEKVKSEK
jgi:putative inorganic carbon (hco3(-)) transporter